MSEALSEHLPLLSTAPDGIQKLRGLILELAVRGKLVPQDPKDEPASELLKRIAKERARLEGKGTCKKSKAMPLVYADEEPFTLPSGWQWTRLDSIVPLPIVDGDWIETKDQDVNGSVRLIQLADVGVGEFKDKSARFVNDETFIRLNCTEIVTGDILVARLPSPIGRACIFPGLKQKAITVVDVAILRPMIGTCSDYFVLAINANPFRDQVENYGKGATRFRVSTGHLKTIVLPVPPLAEQHRIVAKVDELMELCDRLEAEQSDATNAHAKLVEALLGNLIQSCDADELAANWQRLSQHFDHLFSTETSLYALKQTILQLAVMGKLVPQDPKDEPASELLKRISTEKTRLMSEGKIKKTQPMIVVGDGDQLFELPDKWRWVHVSDVALTSTGKTPPTANAYFYGDSIPFIGPGQITLGSQMLQPEKWLSDEGKVETTMADVGDVLMVCIGGSIGKCAIVDRETAFNQQINCAKPLIVASRYLFIAMTSPVFQHAVVGAATGSATPIINRSNWDELAIPLPPIPEQHRIAAKVEELMTICDRLKADLAESRTRQSLLSATLIESALQAA